MNILASWLGDFWEFIARFFTVPPGDGQMRMAAFVRFDGADGLGHVGWAFDFGASNVNAGSVENPNGTPTCPPSTMNYWDEFFASPISTMQEKGYIALKYINLERANPVGAYRVAKWIGTQSYDVVGRNCLDDTYDVLRAYGAPELPPPSTDLLPDLWFNAVAAALAQVQGYDWTRNAPHGLRERVGLAIARFAPMKIPTWRRPGHQDARNLQAQMAAAKTTGAVRSPRSA
jgi:hypothetical protein